MGDLAGGTAGSADLIGDVRLADLERIRSLALTYCFALDSEDVPLLKSVFWPDATDDHGSLFTGLAWDFADYFITRRARVRPTMHMVMNHIVHFDAADPDIATGTVYGVGYQFAHARPAPRTRAVLGWYEDLYRRQASEWKIQNRRFVYIGTMTEQPEQVTS
jgi:hypothetical protein